MEQDASMPQVILTNNSLVSNSNTNNRIIFDIDEEKWKEYPLEKKGEAFVKFFNCRKNELTTTLRRLRRRKTNGIINGVIQLWFHDICKNGMCAHIINFVVGDTKERHVYYIDIVNNQVVKDDITKLLDFEYYQENIHYLPSFDLEENLESTAKVSKDLKAEMKEIKEEGKRKSVDGSSSFTNSKKQRIDLAVDEQGDDNELLLNILDN
jgi:hypothetical protein